MSLKHSLDELRKELARRRKADKKYYDDLPDHPTPDGSGYEYENHNNQNDDNCVDSDGDTISHYF